MPKSKEMNAFARVFAETIVDWKLIEGHTVDIETDPALGETRSLAQISDSSGGEDERTTTR